MAKKKKTEKVKTGADMITRMIDELEAEQDRCNDVAQALRDLPPMGDQSVERTINALRNFRNTDGPQTFVPALVDKLGEFVEKSNTLREEYLG